MDVLHTLCPVVFYYSGSGMGMGYRLVQAFPRLRLRTRATRARSSHSGICLSKHRLSLSVNKHKPVTQIIAGVICLYRAPDSPEASAQLLYALLKDSYHNRF